MVAPIVTSFRESRLCVPLFEHNGREWAVNHFALKSAAEVPKFAKEPAVAPGQRARGMEYPLTITEKCGRRKF